MMDLGDAKLCLSLQIVKGFSKEVRFVSQKKSTNTKTKISTFDESHSFPTSTKDVRGPEQRIENSNNEIV